MATAQTTSIPRMDWLDYARLVCALWVLADHYLITAVNPTIAPITGYGLAGEIARFGTVALFVFLMMSGMVITLVAQRQSAATFVTHRVARVYPTFVLGMTITAIVSQFAPVRHATLPQYLANLAINAPMFGYRFVDAVYWTLIIELIFYAAVLAVILFGWIRHLQRVLCVWIALQCLCVLLPGRIPLFGYDYYFLAAGSVFALLYQRRNERLNMILLMVSLGLCIRCAILYAREFHYDPWVSAALTVATFALFLFMRGRQVKLPHARRIGSLTYMLYLLHFRVGLTIFFWWMTESNKWLVVGLVALAMIAVSAAIDDVMEFRLRRTWIRLAERWIAPPFAWWERRRDRAKGAAAPEAT